MDKAENLAELKNSIEVFLEKDVSEDEIKIVENQLRAINYVEVSSFISKEETLENFKEESKYNRDITNNLFQNDYIVRVTDSSKQSINTVKLYSTKPRSAELN